MTKYKGSFRIESSRLKTWDYSNPWWYYITVNTKIHVSYFGRVEKGKMILSEIGKIVEKYWKEIPTHFPGIELDYYIIMPNHLHGIIIINPQVETPDRASLQNPLLSQIINQFKGSVKRWANKNNYTNFSWQPRFYDRIIRNEKELFNIRKYIEQNPLKWELEKDKLENIYEL
ncbi:MAG: transposase [Melioribacter sp.]|nr:transposase [Melioribacter sp.]